jgi:hypothetical protein
MGIRVNFWKKLVHPSRINYRANPVNIYATTPNPRADGAKRRARVLIPPGYLHPGTE